VTRLALFLLALLAVFGGAAGFGRAVGPIERDTAEPEHASEVPAGPVGLSLAANGFRVSPARTSFETRRPQRLTFRIVGAHEFDVVHTRRMHLIVVRRDLTQFQHLHPIRRRDGSWTTALRFSQPGVYRAFADFSADGKRTVLGTDLFVRGAAVAGARHVASPNVRMTREPAALRFDIGAEPQPYLGARGHLVVLRAGDLAYVHTHPETDELRFETELPTPGRYRAFLQYKLGGRVHTATFALEQR
jgi:hypothetical protein